MSDDPRSPPAPPSLTELIEGAVETAVEIGSSLLAAGRGVLALATRLVRLAQEQLARTGILPSTREAPAERRVPGSPATPRGASAALALDTEAVTGPGAAAAASPSAAPAADPLETSTPGLPDHYGQDRLVVLPRDPGSLFAWWEVTPETRTGVTEELAATDEEPLREALRIVPLGAPPGELPPEAEHPLAIELPPLASSWYVEVPRGQRRFSVALGVVAGDRFLELAEPVLVELPASDVSGDLSTRWRRVGDPQGEPIADANPVPQETTDRLLERVRSSVPASLEWPGIHRLLELGGSHAVPVLR